MLIANICFYVYSRGETAEAGGHFLVGKGNIEEGSRALGTLSSCET